MAKLNSEMKHVILVREDLKMSRGKYGVQTSHATAKALMKASDDIIEEWDKGCIKTIILGVKDAYALVDLDYKIDRSGLAHKLIVDLGVTEFGIPTITAMGIIGESDKIDEFTSELSLYQPNEEFLEKNFGLKPGETQDVMKKIEKQRVGGFGSAQTTTKTE